MFWVDVSVIVVMESKNKNMEIWETNECMENGAEGSKRLMFVFANVYG